MADIYKKDFLFTGLSIGSRALSNLVLYLVLARTWSPESFGVFVWAMSISTVMSLIIDFGLQTYVMREVSAKPEKTMYLASQALGFKVGMLGIYVLAIGITVLIYEKMAIYHAIILPLLLYSAISSYTEFYFSILRATGNYNIESKIVISGNIVQFIAATTSALIVGSMESVAWSLVVSRLAYTAYANHEVTKHLGRQVVPNIRIRSVITCFKSTWHYGVEAIITTTWLQADVIIVSTIFGFKIAGVYAAGQRIVQGVSILAPVVGNIMIPTLSRLSVTNIEKMILYAKKTLGIMTLTGLTLALPLIVFPTEFVMIIFGSEYHGLIGYIGFFGMLIVCRFMATASGILNVAIGIQKSRLFAQISGMTFFGLGLLLAGSIALRDMLLLLCASFLIIAYINLLNWRKETDRIRLNSYGQFN